MQTNGMKRRGIGTLLTPIIAYFAVDFVIAIFASVAVMAKQLPKFTEGSVDGAMQMELYQEMLLEIVKMGTLLATIGAILMIPMFLFMFYRDRKLERTYHIPQAPKEQLWKYGMIVPLAAAVGIAANNVIMLLSLPALSEGYQEASASLYAGSFWLQIVGLGMLVPISEELMFRGLLFRRMKGMFPVKRAMILSSLLFAVFHGNFVQGIYGFGIGLLLCFLYEKYGSLKAPILGHISANLMSVLATNTGFFTWIFRSPMYVGIVTVACAAVSASLIVWMMNHTQSNHTQSGKENEEEKCDGNVTNP